jgi:hypothetical protein
MLDIVLNIGNRQVFHAPEGGRILYFGCVVGVILHHLYICDPFWVDLQRPNGLEICDPVGVRWCCKWDCQFDEGNRLVSARVRNVNGYTNLMLDIVLNIVNHQVFHDPEGVTHL